MAEVMHYRSERYSGAYPSREWLRPERSVSQGWGAQQQDDAQFAEWAESVISREPLSRERALFNRLAGAWVKDTSVEPSLLKKSMHPSYQRIIAMGPKVIPLILKEMEKRPGHWFWALGYLIQDEPNPASGCESLADARDAWLQWGMAKGYL